MWVVCPIREQADKEQYNTAVLINRAGEVAGYYRMESTLPSKLCSD